MSKKHLPDGIRVRWLGHATFDIVGPAGQKFLIDPFLVENEFSHVVADPVAGKLRIARGFSDWPGARPASQRPARGTTVGEETAAVLAAAGISLTS